MAIPLDYSGSTASKRTGPFAAAAAAKTSHSRSGYALIRTIAARARHRQIVGMDARRCRFGRIERLLQRLLADLQIAECLDLAGRVLQHRRRSGEESRQRRLRVFVAAADLAEAFDAGILLRTGLGAMAAVAGLHREVVAKIVVVQFHRRPLEGRAVDVGL